VSYQSANVDVPPHPKHLRDDDLTALHVPQRMLYPRLTGRYTVLAPHKEQHAYERLVQTTGVGGALACTGTNNYYDQRPCSGHRGGVHLLNRRVMVRPGIPGLSSTLRLMEP
jgi:hypothetical protein